MGLGSTTKKKPTSAVGGSQAPKTQQKPGPQPSGGFSGVYKVPVPGGPVPVGVPGAPAGAWGPHIGAPTVSHAGSAPAPFVNTAQVDPRLDRHAQRIEDRLANPEASTGRAIDMATSKIRDAAAGRQRAIEEQYGAAGMGGSGFETSAALDLEGGVGRAIAGASADISLGRERDEDSFLLGATDALGAPGAAARQDRQLALQQYVAQEGARRQAEAAQLAQQMAILDLLGVA